MVQTHTHTTKRHDTVSHTLKFRKAARTKGKRGADQRSIGFVSLHKHPDSCFTDVTHTSTDSKIHKPLTRKDTGVGLCYIHLAQQRRGQGGGGQNVSIAHCGTFHGDKKVKLGIFLTKLKLDQTTVPSPAFTMCLHFRLL